MATGILGNPGVREQGLEDGGIGHRPGTHPTGQLHQRRRAARTKTLDLAVEIGSGRVEDDGLDIQRLPLRRYPVDSFGSATNPIPPTYLAALHVTNDVEIPLTGRV
ncbi:hypothetical protein GCM10027089_35580 [Nocardia thraciensis]